MLKTLGGLLTSNVYGFWGFESSSVWTNKHFLGNILIHPIIGPDESWYPPSRSRVLILD